MNKKDKNPTPESFQYTVDQIKEMTRWQFYEGFVGMRCGSCEKTANVLGGSPGWICVCGWFNIQPFHGGPQPHENPDLGPALETIRKAHGTEN